MTQSSRFIATYRIASYLPLEQAASVLAGEQSSGTFTKVALESESLLREHGAEVVRIAPEEPQSGALPGSYGAAEGTALNSGTVEVAFPAKNIGPSIAAFLTTIAGNLYELRELAGVKLLDVEIPALLKERYRGPVHGVPGTRDLIGNAEEVLLGTIIKPSIGLSNDQLGGLVRELALAEIDFIKDDELNSNPQFAPLNERIDRVMAELRSTAESTGKLPMYAFNITDDLENMKTATERIADAGGTCAMVVVPAIGFSALTELRRHTDLAIHAHRGGFGMFDRSPDLGIGFRAYQKLVALAGADHFHVGGVNSKFWEPNRSVIDSVTAMQHDVPTAQAMLPVLSSAQTAATAASTFEMLPSKDLLVLAGGGIHAHPGGVAEGVRSMKDAWGAVVRGQNPADAATPGSALAVALDTFGA